MGYHTFDSDRADDLEQAGKRYRQLSAEELVWALDPDPGDTVADLGSGTGFYTDDVAPHVDQAYAVDVQAAMHDYYREKGVPANVDLVTSAVASLPFGNDALDGAVSTMTYHEFASDAALTEVRRVLAPGARFVVADWAGTGTGEYGPPVAERYTAADAVAVLEQNGFGLSHQAVRPETFLLVASPAL